MQTINKQQFEEMRLKKFTMRTKNPIIQAILDLPIDEGLFISREEWPYKSSISQVFRWNDLEGKEYSCSKHLDGFAVLRTK